MRPPGRPKAEYRSAQREGSPARPWAVARGAPRHNPGPPGRGHGSPGCARAQPGLRAGLLLAAIFASSALAGPVLVYREGPAWCPHDRPADAPRLTPAQAVERAKTLLPKDFCGPSWWVSGCNFDPEYAYDTWRVFAQQYKLVDGRKEKRGRDHSYVVLDLVGNCVANIPGT